MVTDLERLFAQLSREPDFDADELQAYDATDELLLETAAEWIAGGHEAPPGTVVTIGDRHGALTLGARIRFGARQVRAYQDPLLQERALIANADRLGLRADVLQLPLGEELLRGARLVLVQLPRGLAALEEIAQAIARWAHPEVLVWAGGRVKHMTRAMNEVLGRSFTEVQAGLAHRKSRVLRARGPRSEVAAAPPSFPVWGTDPELAFRLAAFGGTFGGATLDHGTRLLLRTLRQSPPTHSSRIVDLGCGNGVIATAAALAFPEARVIATDQSRAAVAATACTVADAGVTDRVAIHRADATEAVPAQWADLILLNPPFHSGATVHEGVGQRLIAACADVLEPGGELRFVFNSHLRYRALVERCIGPTRQLARDRTFTVLAAQKRHSRT